MGYSYQECQQLPKAPRSVHSTPTTALPAILLRRGTSGYIHRPMGRPLRDSEQVLSSNQPSLLA